MTSRFTELKNSAYQSSQVIEAQLQSVESSLLGAAVAVLISALVSGAFGLLVFWIPASFIVLWVLLMLSAFRTVILSTRRVRRLFRTGQSDNAQTAGLSPEANLFLLNISFKNAMPVFKTIGVIFLASILSLLIYRIGLIGWFTDFCVTIPLISSLLFLPLPLLVSRVIVELERRQYELDFGRLSCGAGCLISVGALVYVLVLLAFPIWSFVLLHPIYADGLRNNLSLVVVIILLTIVALAFVNYFSASLVRKEMGIALLRLSNIQNRIEGLLTSQGSIPDETYQGLMEEYTEAKRYDMTTDDSLLINYYSLRPNPTYLSELNSQ